MFSTPNYWILVNIENVHFLTGLKFKFLLMFFANIFDFYPNLQPIFNSGIDNIINCPLPNKKTTKKFVPIALALDCHKCRYSIRYVKIGGVRELTQGLPIYSVKNYSRDKTVLIKRDLESSTNGWKIYTVNNEVVASLPDTDGIRTCPFDPNGTWKVMEIASRITGISRNYVILENPYENSLRSSMITIGASYLDYGSSWNTGMI